MASIFSQHLAVAHECHQGEGGEDEELVDEAEHRAGRLRHQLLFQVVLQHQGEEGEQQHGGKVDHHLVVLRPQEGVAKESVDEDRRS